MMIHFLQALHRTALGLLRTPSFSVPVLLVLALGIGATTAVFGALRTILLATPSYPEPSQVVLIQRSLKGIPNSTMPASWPEYQDYQGRLSTLEFVAGLNAVSMNLTGVETPALVRVGRITPDYFRVFRIGAQLGTLLWEPNAERGAILSENYWRQQMGSDPAILGRSIILNGLAHPVLGVVPSRFSQKECDVFIPLVPDEEQKTSRGSKFLPLVGRLRGGATPAQAEMELDTVNRVATQARPDDQEALSFSRVRPLLEARREGHQNVVRILGLACGLVLLIALVNLSGQFLVRSLGRTADAAIRLSLGASPFQTLKPGLLEASLLSFAGALLGLGVAWAGLALLRPLVSQDLVANQPMVLDRGMLGFALLLCFATTLLVSAVPGLLFARLRPAEVLKEGGRSLASGHGRRLRPALVVLQVGLALSLLGSFGVLTKSLLSLYRVPLGLRPEGVAVFRCRMPYLTDAEGQQTERRVQGILERMRAVPGVQAAGTISPLLPVQGAGWNSSLTLKGEKLPHSAWFEIRQASPDLFRALGVDLLRGRNFEEADYRPDPGVVIVSEGTAARCWPGKDPIGQELSRDEGRTWLRVVGVVADVRNAGPAKENWANKSVYHPRRIHHFSTFFVVRFASPKQIDLAALRSLMRQDAPEWPLADLQTMPDVIAKSLEDRKILVQLLGLASLLALGLALVGVQGVLGYQVARRTREMGIRFALGATRLQVSWLVLKEALLLAGLGVVMGLGGASAGAQLIAHQFPDSGSAQPFTLLAAVAVLLAGASFASLQPALAASHIRPSEALRSE